ncbi:kinase-like domain-containing protein [Cerioporus squamosus]|nr:kinase-like domain-containing protein [Cerioporus squamosus]
MGTTREGHNVAIRIVCVRDKGKEHMQILRRIARGDLSLLTENHVAPLWGEVEIGHITFAVTPFIGHNMSDCYGAWAKNSVGDIVDMITQALEALAFLHQLGIVHRDAEKDNFMVQWHPESLAAMQVPICRPRVFVIDFEAAHEFPPHTPEEERRLVGPPWDDYLRDTAPEVAAGPYDPFKVDVWQLAHSFSDFKSTVAEIDAVLETLRLDDPACRPTAVAARDQLAGIIHSLPPVSLLIPPAISGFN